jgi:ectoine hydroxylase
LASAVGSIEHARPIPAAERGQFDRDGYLIIRGALTPDEVCRYADALDRVYAAATAGGRVPRGAAMHQLGAAANCPKAAALLDHPATFGYVWSLLGWNIRVYHSHLNVHPPLAAKRPFRFECTKTPGGRTARSRPIRRPRLSDVSEPGPGNFKVVSGSHLTNWTPGGRGPDAGGFCQRPGAG